MKVPFCAHRRNNRTFMDDGQDGRHRRPPRLSLSVKGGFVRQCAQKGTFMQNGGGRVSGAGRGGD